MDDRLPVHRCWPVRREWEEFVSETATATATTSLLDAAEIEAYHRDGYVVPRFRLPAADLSRLQTLMASLVAENPGLINKPIVSPHVPGGGVQELKTSGDWMDIATHPSIVDMVEQLAGPDIILWGTTVFYKRAMQGPATAWHRDGQAWPIAPLATTSVWIAATDSTTENGRLRVIPGSHKAKRIGEHVFVDRDDLIVRRTLAADEFDETLARDIELAAGQMVMFDVFTVHGAAHNRGSRPRAGYALRFMPATSHFDHDAARYRDEPGYAHDTRALLLVRGVDRCGRNDFRRGHPALVA
jgi:hypothetical protein